MTFLVFFTGEDDKAVIEESFEFGDCCIDGSGAPDSSITPAPLQSSPGLASLATVQLEAETCSSRTCERGQGRRMAAWVTRQQVTIGLRHTGVQTATLSASHCVNIV